MITQENKKQQLSSKLAQNMHLMFLTPRYVSVWVSAQPPPPPSPTSLCSLSSPGHTDACWATVACFDALTDFTLTNRKCLTLSKDFVFFYTQTSSCSHSLLSSLFIHCWFIIMAEHAAAAVVKNTSYCKCITHTSHVVSCVWRSQEVTNHNHATHPVLGLHDCTQQQTHEWGHRGNFGFY